MAEEGKDTKLPEEIDQHDLVDDFCLIVEKSAKRVSTHPTYS